MIKLTSRVERSKINFGQGAKSCYRIRRCLVPLNDRHFAKPGGGLDKGYFYFKQIYILNKLEIKKLSQSIFFKFVMIILRIIHILI